jgi:hypothetical protein
MQAQKLASRAVLVNKKLDGSSKQMMYPQETLFHMLPLSAALALFADRFDL